MREIRIGDKYKVNKSVVGTVCAFDGDVVILQFTSSKTESTWKHRWSKKNLHRQEFVGNDLIERMNFGEDLFKL